MEDWQGLLGLLESGSRRREDVFQRLDDIDDNLARSVGQPWVLFSESNDGVAGVPKFLDLYSHTATVSLMPTARD